MSKVMKKTTKTTTPVNTDLVKEQEHLNKVVTPVVSVPVVEVASEVVVEGAATEVKGKPKNNNTEKCDAIINSLIEKFGLNRDSVAKHLKEQGILSKNSVFSKKNKDKNAPKKPSTPYLIFASEKRPIIKAEHPDISVTDATKLIAKEWKEITPEQKEYYLNKGKEKREAYDIVKKEYDRTKMELAAAAAPVQAPVVKKEKKVVDHSGDPNWVLHPVKNTWHTVTSKIGKELSAPATA